MNALRMSAIICTGALSAVAIATATAQISRGQSTTPLVSVDLASEIDSVQGRMLRMQMTTYDPGASGMAHSHKDRPEVVYVLSGKITRDTLFEGDDHRAHRKRENLLDLFDKADALGFLHGADSGRTIGQAAVAGILAIHGFTTVLPTCVTTDDVR